MSEANKTLMQRWVELLNKGKASAVAAVDEFCTPDYVLHDATLGDIKGCEGFRQFLEKFFNAIPDGRVTMDHSVAEGNMITFRLTIRGTHQGEFMGVAPTGRPVVMSLISIMRMEEGKVAEEWEILDTFGLLQQLGALPALGKGEEKAAA